MMRAEDSPIYGDLMRFKPDGLTPNGWAVKAGVSRTVWADMRRHGNPSRRTLEKLLAAAGSSLAEFEAIRVGGGETRSGPVAGAVGEANRRGWINAPLPPLPLIQSRVGGEWAEPDSGIELMEIVAGERLDLLPRPQSLAGDPDAFAITVVGDSMWPRFRPGRRIAVSPRAPVAIGDDVLVRLASGQDDRAGSDLALLKELVRRSSTYIELRQFNPDKLFRVDLAQLGAIQKVVGELI